MARKLSRQQRKSHRERSVRAEQRGLPAQKLQKPSKPPVGRFESGRRESPDADDVEPEADVSTREPVRVSPFASLVEQLKGYPMSLKIAAIAAIAFALIWAISLVRKKDQAPVAPSVPAAPSAEEQRPQVNPPGRTEQPPEMGASPATAEPETAPPSASAKGQDAAQGQASSSASEQPPVPKKKKKARVTPPTPGAAPQPPAAASENPY